MSSPRERNPTPNPFRDQYTGGVMPDPEVEAILMGSNTPNALRASVPPVSHLTDEEFQWINQGTQRIR